MHHLITASSCFPNCHPAGTDPTQLQQSGNLGLGVAAILVIVLLLLSRRSRG